MTKSPRRSKPPLLTRQLASRARERVRARRPKTRVKREKHQQLLWAFLQACDAGDASRLFGLLKQDAVLYSDGGGKVSADRIIRFVLGLRQKGIGDLRGRPFEVNGAPGATLTLDGQPYSIQTIEVEEDRVRSIVYVMNPAEAPARRLPPVTHLRNFPQCQDPERLVSVSAPRNAPPQRTPCAIMESDEELRISRGCPPHGPERVSPAPVFGTIVPTYCAQLLCLQ